MQVPSIAAEEAEDFGYFWKTAGSTRFSAESSTAAPGYASTVAVADQFGVVIFSDLQGEAFALVAALSPLRNAGMIWAIWQFVWSYVRKRREETVCLIIPLFCSCLCGAHSAIAGGRKQGELQEVGAATAAAAVARAWSESTCLGFFTAFYVPF
jgi:hypothetical protein